MGKVARRDLVLQSVALLIDRGKTGRLGGRPHTSRGQYSVVVRTEYKAWPSVVLEPTHTGLGELIIKFSGIF